MNNNAVRNKCIVLLFSGGLDSTAVAIQFLQRGINVKMLTFYNGAQKWLDLAQAKAAYIMKNYPTQASWEMRDCTFLFHELAIQTLARIIHEN